MIEDTWPNVCVLCATRDRQTRLKYGHVCAACATRIDNDLASIVHNGDLSAVSERTTPSGITSHGYESKPPTDLDRAAPYLVLVRLNPGQQPAVHRSVAFILSEWEKQLRDLRPGYAPYGPATAHHTGTDEGILAAQCVRQAVHTLRSSLEWIVSEPAFPIEDCAEEITRCASRMRALVNTDARDRMVTCPTIIEQAPGHYTECGYRLTIRTWAALDEDVNGRRDWTTGDDVTCQRCHATRSPQQLLHAAGKEDTWADAEALAQWFGVGKSTLRRWAGSGKVRRQHGLYSWADVTDIIGHQRAGT